MANLVNGDITWVGEQAFEYTLLEAFKNPEMSALFRIDLTAANKKQYALLGERSKAFRAAANCAKESTGSVPKTQKFMELALIYNQAEQCADEFFDQFENTLLKTGVDRNNLEGTYVERVLGEVVGRDAITDLHRLIWFGDTDLSDNFYSLIDGFRTKLIAAATAGDIVKAYTIGNGDLAACESRLIFQALYSQANTRLKSLPVNQKIMMVSGTIWENWLSCKETGDGCCTELGYQLEINGVQAMSYRGIPVVPIYIWDEVVSEQDTAVYDYEHFAIYAQRDNLIVGTDATSSTTKVDFWYDKTDDLNYWRMQLPLGTLVLDDNLVTVAF